jgi:hypothetical protein
MGKDELKITSPEHKQDVFRCLLPTHKNKKKETTNI